MAHPMASNVSPTSLKEMIQKRQAGADPSPRRGANRNSINTLSSTTLVSTGTGSSGTPSPTKASSPNRHKSPPPPTTYHQPIPVPPIPIGISKRFSAIGAPVVPSPYTQINTEFHETMDELNRANSPEKNTPPSALRQSTATQLQQTQTPTKQVSPRHSIASAGSTGLGQSTTSYLASPSHSPPFDAHSPRRRTPDRSLPLNEEHEEIQNQSQREHDQSPDSEEGDVTITPSIAKRTAAFYPIAPVPISMPMSSLAENKSRERLADYLTAPQPNRDTHTLDWSSRVSPSQSLTSTLVQEHIHHRPQEEDEDEDEEDEEEDEEEYEEADSGEYSEDGRASRAGHREDELEDGAVPDPNGGELGTIVDADEEEEEGEEGEEEEEEGEETEGAEGQFTPRSPSAALHDAPQPPAQNASTNPFIARLQPQSQHLAPPAQPRSRTSSTSSHLPRPSRHAISELAMPLSSQTWSGVAHFDPAEIEEALAKLQRAISPLATSRYRHMNNYSRAEGSVRDGEGGGGGGWVGMLAPPEGSEALNGLIGDGGYYGYQMGMMPISPAPTMPNGAGTSLSAMVEAIAGSTPAPAHGQIPSPIPEEGHQHHPENGRSAPVPPTPLTNTNANTNAAPSPQVPRGESVPPLGEHNTHPVPFTYMRRNPTFPIAPQTQYPFGYNVLNHPQVHPQNINAYGGPVLTDSTFSPAGTPYPHPVFPYNPFIHANVMGDTMSMRSSPSHLPVEIPPPMPVGGARKLKRKGKMSSEVVNGVAASGSKAKGKGKAPQRRVGAMSTEPMTTDDELAAGVGVAVGDETEDYGEMMTSQFFGHGDTTPGPEDDDEQEEEEGEEGEWVDEADPYGEDLLHLEYHPSYVMNPDRRKKAWDEKWGALRQAFKDLDRTTDSTLLLLAAPPHTPKTFHAVTSRSMRRSPQLRLHQSMASARQNFQKLHLLSLQHRRSLQQAQINPDALTSPEELREALQGALGTLSQLGKMYDDLERRWAGEMTRFGEERESVNVILRQALGRGVPGGGGLMSMAGGNVATESLI